MAPMCPEQHFSALSLEIICTIAFGNGEDDAEVAAIGRMFERNWDYQGRFGAWVVVPGFIDLPLAANRRMKVLVQVRIHESTRDAVD